MSNGEIISICLSTAIITTIIIGLVLTNIDHQPRIYTDIHSGCKYEHVSKLKLKPVYDVDGNHVCVLNDIVVGE